MHAVTILRNVLRKLLRLSAAVSALRLRLAKTHAARRLAVTLQSVQVATALALTARLSNLPATDGLAVLPEILSRNGTISFFIVILNEVS